MRPVAGCGSGARGPTQGSRASARLRRGRAWWLACAAGASLACQETTAPPEPVTFLAIVTKVSALRNGWVGDRYQYHVSEVSGTLGIDTVIAVAPRDTLILKVPPATYGVDLTLPPTCSAPRGADQSVVVSDRGLTGEVNNSTSVVRFRVECRPSLMIRTTTEGYGPPDHAMVYQVTDAAGAQARLGVVTGQDSVPLDRLPPGTYHVRLLSVQPNCVVVNQGGQRRSVEVPDVGGADVWFRLSCSDPAGTPHLLEFSGSYRAGTAGFYFRASDPNHDIERYVWDLTDCRGRSLLPGGAQLRRGLSSGRTARQDTVVVLGAFDVGLPDDSVAGGCLGLRVMDQYDNSTPMVEEAIGNERGTPPVAIRFNAVRFSDLSLRTDLAVSDAENDFLGTFVAAVIVDGVLGPANGQADIGYYNASGYLGAGIPDLPFSGRVGWQDARSLVVYLIDRQGLVTRIQDIDLSR